MSTSEQDVSDSNLESPFSQSDSPYSSPSHQVPQLANIISDLSCAENTNMPKGNMPYLSIVEQPQNHFRFRYKSEMIGTHGCLLGKSYATSKSKSHPTVELRNYTGRALVRCRLARHDSADEHPHKLLEEDQDRDVHSWLPEKGSYRVAFRGMGIIHTAKKDVPALLYKRYASEKPETAFNENKLRLKCENEAKNINLNIVRLKFSAHDPNTDAEICPPVYSEWIHNMKSAATNDLKICRMSRCYGRPKGKEDVFIFVEKVNKKNIMIKFFELDKYGERVWSKMATFLQSDVHHQYGIVFRTPEYHNLHITSDVKVFIELVRPSDGRTSEPKEFTYKAETIYIQNKKRKANSSFSSIGSSGSSIKSVSDLPTTVEYANQFGEFNNMTNNGIEVMDHPPVAPMYHFKVPQNQIAPTEESMMADALLHSYVGSNPVQSKAMSPLLSQPNVPEPPVLQLHSSELDRVLEQDIDLLSEDKKRFFSTDLGDYFEQYDGVERSTMEWIKSSMMVADSAKRSEKNTKYKELLKSEVKDEPKSNVIRKPPSEYSALYKAEDGVEVQKLIKELCEMMRNKDGIKKQDVRSKLDRLLEMRLSNGDTFLHLTLSSNQPSLEYIVKLIYNMKMTKLLNLKNNQMQTVLHLAIINDSPKLVSFLISKGCDPMEEDNEGNNALHYAVICQTCLGPLLESIKNNNISYDIDAYNNEKQTALHLSSVYGCRKSATLLLSAGAKWDARDGDGRTALHLAVLDDCLPVANELLEKPVSMVDVDALDGKGYTALQIACDSVIRENTLEIVKLLLDKKADPLKHEENNHSAWRLARDKPQLAKLMRKYISSEKNIEIDIKSEPEDDDDSEEKDTESDLTALPMYIDRVAVLLDNNGGWKELMGRLDKDSYYSWYKATDSPARTLLNHLKGWNEGVSSKSLALLLDDIGQHEAATIIKACIDEPNKNLK
ncbi:nuclear factor NF-kappa-B p110 subunit isoform X1 [Danaus plexippus]|uniref:nuclear factor NF-kappa-B p110 subunit isoform X1 n=1 Tax=Danaus plexippus TaxID=13037 RepID=UPI002AB3131A|nr:nuclear factor NF-kappa-B p110 subunit isoform X1 [Danaus plexippus]